MKAAYDGITGDMNGTSFQKAVIQVTPGGTDAQGPRLGGCPNP